MAIQLTTSSVQAESILVEAESFDSHGGWKLDTQFIDIMGSPYLLAHGLGNPVKDASTTIKVSESGTYHVFVRTKDWVARWKAKGQPGRFEITVDGKTLPETFGTTSADWFWQPGGTVSLDVGEHKVSLHDLTGFEGRCDAIWLTSDSDATPPNASDVLSAWRKTELGLPENPTETGPFDLVVVGGGYAGLGSAISAARMGIKVALIQNRPVLGGNGSSEVRVWAKGMIRRGEYPHIGEIIAELSDQAKKSPGTYEEFEDAKKERIVRAEPNLTLFLNHHAFKVDKKKNRIEAVYAFDTRTSAVRRFSAPLFVDCTGHGTLGFLAEADHEIFDGTRMGMSNMWAWAEADKPQLFPKTPWALDLTMQDFPYPREFHGQWFWESGFKKDSINDLEAIRDWNFRAVYGSWNAMKNKDGAIKHINAHLTWLAYIGGPRESRRLLGDVILTQEDIVSKKIFVDGLVPSTWSIDLHYPKRQYMRKFPDNPFISVAEHGVGVDRRHGYPIPYRCFYSRNVSNLFMAGRDISVTHEALGTTRVMKTCGMMGEVVGKAASLCIQFGCSPRDISQSYLEQLKALVRLSGVTRRDTVDGDFYIRKGDVELPAEPSQYVLASTLKGIVIDDLQAELTGTWTKGSGLKPLIEDNYQYGKGGTAKFTFEVPKVGEYEVRFATGAHANRTSELPLTISHSQGETTVKIDQQKPGEIKPCFVTLGKYQFEPGIKYSVSVDATNVNGNAQIDAVWIVQP
ncbi:MAG: FAD-dependent oxidoreductase [Planctomycetaceae bacterium]|nr:FAD-dependent oxidoreductase [Planctomycetaceae bacterium]